MRVTTWEPGFGHKQWEVFRTPDPDAPDILIPLNGRVWQGSSPITDEAIENSSIDVKQFSRDQLDHDAAEKGCQTPAFYEYQEKEPEWGCTILRRFYLEKPGEVRLIDKKQTRRSVAWL